MEQDESELLALRREKLAALEKLGIAPFGAAFETSGDIAQVRERFAQDANFRVAGRITAHRDMGKSHFVDLKDASGRIPLVFEGDETRGGPKGRLHRSLVLFDPVTKFPTEVTLLRNFDIFTEVESGTRNDTTKL